MLLYRMPAGPLRRNSGGTTGNCKNKVKFSPFRASLESKKKKKGLSYRKNQTNGAMRSKALIKIVLSNFFMGTYLAMPT